MKRLAVFCMILCMLSGCKNTGQELEQAVSYRQKILSASQCLFDTEVTADYGDKLFTYCAQCRTDANGDLTFTITAPDSIEDITGKISDSGGNLTFDKTALNFPLLSEEALSPVSAPWIFIKTLRSGYLTSAGKDSDDLRLTLNDSYREDALMVDIWLNQEDQPIRADILHNGSRILSLTIRNFQIV